MHFPLNPALFYMYATLCGQSIHTCSIPSKSNFLHLQYGNETSSRAIIKRKENVTKRPKLFTCLPHTAKQEKIDLSPKCIPGILTQEY